MFGIIFGALLVQFADWPWVFWLITLVSAPISVLALYLIPPQKKTTAENESVKHLDVIGVSTLTIGFLLFIFAIVSGSNDAWDSARVLAPLVISIVMIIGFFFYEARLPEEEASL